MLAQYELSTSIPQYFTKPCQAIFLFCTLFYGLSILYDIVSVSKI